MITLPDRNSNEGAEARVLLAECPGPANAAYTLDLATEAMKLMDAVLRNRLSDPARFLAPRAKTLIDIIKAKGQFQGFENYPDYDTRIKNNIQDAIDIANNPKDSRSEKYTEFVNKAIEVAKLTTYTDPSPGKLAAWRTANSGSPGKGFFLYKTLLGNDFYYMTT